MAVTCMIMECARCGRKDEFTGPSYGEIQRKIVADGWRTRYSDKVKKMVDFCPAVDCQQKGCYNDK